MIIYVNIILSFMPKFFLLRLPNRNSELNNKNASNAGIPQKTSDGTGLTRQIMSQVPPD
jgi:hypothetical protein